MARNFDTSVVDHAGCNGCPQHVDTGSGCKVVERDGAAPLDAFLARDACYLKDRLRGFARQYLRHRPRMAIDAEDLMQEVSVRLLSDEERRSGGLAQGLAPFLGYLRRMVLSCAVSFERRERGRVRCGNCGHFAPYSSICLAPGHHWTHERVARGQDPRALAPACDRFTSLRIARDFDLDAAPAREDELRREDADTAGFHDALVQLAATNPRAALVVRARLLDGRSYRDLEAPGLSVRTLKRDFAAGLRFLQERMSIES